MPETRIDLFCMGSLPADLHWEHGQVWACQPTPEHLASLARGALESSPAVGWLFWDPRLGEVPAGMATRLLQSPDDLWHAGLKLGMAGLPHSMDFVSPTWMLNRDPDPNICATSWRVSLRACLVRTEVIRQLGFIDPKFMTLETAALEWGHRCISRGVLCRHESAFVPHAGDDCLPPLPATDELRFVLNRFGRRWMGWAVLRAVLSGYWSPTRAWPAWRKTASDPSLPQPVPYRREHCPSSMPKNAAVSVLIPTVERYPYLRNLLDQLRCQTVPAAEIIIVDQTPPRCREPHFHEAFRDLPIRHLVREEAGQCSSRNAGLQVARGDHVLFLDDDDEVPADLIERHLANLQRFEADASCGVAHETGAGSLPEAFTFLRASDVFPTNNSMIRRSILQKTGLFDLAYDHGARADADLGMRLYLSGARMVLDPGIAVIHHHAPGGGLRVHKARVITYASSRRHISHRSLPAATEMYLARRYYTNHQQVEMHWLSIFSSFSLHDASLLKRLLKILVSGLFLPDTLLRIRRNDRQALALTSVHPTIPRLETDPSISDKER